MHAGYLLSPSVTQCCYCKHARTLLHREKEKCRINQLLLVYQKNVLLYPAHFLLICILATFQFLLSLLPCYHNKSEGIRGMVLVYRCLNLMPTWVSCMPFNYCYCSKGDMYNHTFQPPLDEIFNCSPDISYYCELASAS